jgi:hypothetical protein
MAIWCKWAVDHAVAHEIDDFERERANGALGTVRRVTRQLVPNTIKMKKIVPQIETDYGIFWPVDPREERLNLVTMGCFPFFLKNNRAPADM